MVKAVPQKTLLSLLWLLCGERIERTKPTSKDNDLIAMTKHGPGREKTSNSEEYTEKQTWSRRFRDWNDKKKMGRKQEGKREEKRK